MEYLSGYEIFPLGEVWGGGGKSGYSLEGLRKNLKKDAEFFQLKGLIRALEEEEENIRVKRELEEKRWKVPPVSMAMLKAMKIKWPLEVLEWDEYYLLGDEKIDYKGLIRLRDVELR